MRVFLTGGTGFIGRRIAERLRARGDEVVALVRSPDKAKPLVELGCETVAGDLGARDAIDRGVKGADAVLHAGADYRVGIPKRERGALREANVEGTKRVLDAAIAAGVPRIVYVSTANVFGHTGDTVADESYTRDLTKGFLSAYDETKYVAHQEAAKRIGRGAPIVIVLPGAVYGPGDTSQVANLIDQARTGKMKLLLFPDFVLPYVHVDDLADGIVRVLDDGRVGEEYVLGGDQVDLRELVTTVSELSDRKPPAHAMPTALMRAGVPIGPVVGKLMGFPPNLGELIRISDDVQIRVTDAKARRELGYTTRPLREGLAQTLAEQPSS